MPHFTWQGLQCVMFQHVSHCIATLCLPFAPPQGTFLLSAQSNPLGKHMEVLTSSINKYLLRVTLHKTLGQALESSTDQNTATCTELTCEQGKWAFNESSHTSLIHHNCEPRSLLRASLRLCRHTMGFPGLSSEEGTLSKMSKSQTGKR